MEAMPHYDYQCQDCGHVFEVFQKITDKPLEKCSQCGGEVKRLIGGGGGIIFKGSGFYVNDYKKKSSPENNSDTKNCSCGTCAATQKADA